MCSLKRYTYTVKSGSDINVIFIFGIENGHFLIIPNLLIMKKWLEVD